MRFILTLISLLLVCPVWAGVTFELLVVAKGPATAKAGHAGLRIGDTVFHYQKGDCGTLDLHETKYEKFLLLYNVNEERDVFATRFDVTELAAKKALIKFRIELQEQKEQGGTCRYSVLGNNCVTTIRNIMNETFPDKIIEDSLFSSIPYLYMLKAREVYPVTEVRNHPSRRNLQLLEKGGLRDYFVPFSSISPEGEQWRLVYTEDLSGVSFVLRPLAGVANLSAGVFQTLWGLPALLWGSDDLANGAVGFLDSFPEIFFMSLRHPQGYSVPDKFIFTPEQTENTFIDYSLPSLEFLVEYKNGEYRSLFEVSGDAKSSELVKTRITDEKINDYLRDSLLKIFDTGKSQWIFNKHRTLDIDELKNFKNGTGKGVKVLLLSRYLEKSSQEDIYYLDFSKEFMAGPFNLNSSDLALTIKENAPGSVVIAGNYSEAADLENAVNFAIAEGVKIIVHTEVFPEAGFADKAKQRSSFVSGLVKKAFENGILWINAAGDFRENVLSLNFANISEVKEAKLEAHAKEPLLVNFDFLDGDQFDIRLYDGEGELVSESSGKELNILSSHDETYRIEIRPRTLSAAKFHSFMVFSSTKVTPNSPNISTLAAPADSSYALTIGSSNNGRPVLSSSEDAFILGWNKPDLYAPFQVSNPRSMWATDLRGTKASAVYAAAFFAILLGQ